MTSISATSIMPVFPSVSTHLHKVQHWVESLPSLSWSPSLAIAMSQQSSCQVTRATGPNPTNPFASQPLVMWLASLAKSQSLSNRRKVKCPLHSTDTPLLKGFLKRKYFHAWIFSMTKKSPSFFPKDFVTTNLYKHSLFLSHGKE